MADVPNRNTSFTTPSWELIQGNPVTRNATVKTQINREGTDVGRAYVASKVGTPDAIVGVPTNITSATMNLVGLDVPVSLWDEHSTVVVNGSEYPEQITGSVPAGKIMTVNAGQRGLQVDETAGALTFKTELPDDGVFIDVEAGGTLNINLDKSDDGMGGASVRTVNMKDPKATGATKDAYVPFPLGGRNVAVVTGVGTVRIDGGNYGNNFFVQADKATVNMGNGVGYYSASGNSSKGHKVTGGKMADVLDYNFTSAGAVTNIGATTFDAGVGSVDSTNIDAIQLRNLPSGSKVVANVSAVRGAGNFKDSDAVLTIKNPAGGTIGTITATNVSYVSMIYADGTVQGFSLQSIGAGASKTYTIGTTAPKAALTADRLAAATNSLSASDSIAANEPFVSPVNLPTPQPEKAAGAKLGG